MFNISLEVLLLEQTLHGLLLKICYSFDYTISLTVVFTANCNTAQEEVRF